MTGKDSAAGNTLVESTIARNTNMDWAPFIRHKQGLIKIKKRL